MKAAFDFVPVSSRRSRRKPRRSGLTMVIDNGIPLGRERDLLALSGRYCDLAKMKTGTSRLYEEAYLRRKLALYDRYRVRPFLGGQFQEYVYATQGRDALPAFMREARRIGFATVEISDNVVPLSRNERKRQIRLAIDCGLTVFGEIGSKEARTSPRTLLRQADDCFEAGAEVVLVEGAELVANGRPKRALLAELRKHLDMTRVLIELPGPWISGVHQCDIEDFKKILVREFGPDVNLANVPFEDLLDLEALRVGLGTVGPPSDARRGPRRPAQAPRLAGT